jgi:hypothetical protein
MEQDQKEVASAARIAELESRLQRLEDIAGIYRLIATYGPSVDSLSIDNATNIWTSDGVYAVDTGGWSGRDEIGGMLNGDRHQSYVRSGCSHQVSAPRVTVDGDRATATCYQSLIERDGETFVIRRQTANVWELVRTDEGWRVHTRTNELLTGAQEARDLLQRGIADAPPAPPKPTAPRPAPTSS